MIQLKKILTLLSSLLFVNAALSISRPCQHAFIVYNADKGTEVTRFTDANYPPQFTLDQSKVSGISKINVIASFCNNIPPFQSAWFVVTLLFDDYSPVHSYESVVAEINLQGDGQQLAVNGNFLKVPGLYNIVATSYSQSGKVGFELDRLEVAVLVYRSCYRGFILYNTDNQSVIARFPDVGTHEGYRPSSNSPLIATTQGTIDLVQLGSTGLNMVAEFCNPLVKNVTFGGTVSRYRPFSIGPKDKNNKLLPTNILKTPFTFYQFDATAISDNPNSSVSDMKIILSIFPSYQVLSFTLVNTYSGKDLAKAVVTDDSLFSRTSYIEVDLADYPANASFSIRANTFGSTVQSVTFGDSVTFTASKAPFALAGLTSTGHYKPVKLLFIPGFYIIYATPFTGPNSSGKNGPVHRLVISVLPRTRISSVTWVDATANSDIHVYQGYVNPYPAFELEPPQYPANATFSIRANPGGKVKSVEFYLSQIDNSQGRSSFYHLANGPPPYCLTGTTAAGHCKAVPVFQTPGSYKLSVTAYAGANKQGDSNSTVYSITILPNFHIVKFIAVDATTGKDLFDMGPWHHNLDLSQFPADKKFSIRAYTAGNVKSVAFSFRVLIQYEPTSRSLFNHVENGPPFAVAGLNASTGIFIPISYLSNPGTYTLDATPYSQKNKGGTVGNGVPLQIDVLPRLRIDSYSLVDATTGVDLRVAQTSSLFDKPLIIMYLNQYPKNTKFSIRVGVAGVAGSVAFQLFRYASDDFTNETLVNSTVDNHAPFALGGDPPAGMFQAVSQLSTQGFYSFVATPYSKANKGGSMGTSAQSPISVYASLPS